MSRFSLLVSLAVALAAVDGVFASPSCSRGMTQAEQCISKCRTKFGWPGFAMGTDAWGVVAKPYSGDINDMVSEACGSTSTATANSSGVTIPAIAAPSPQTTLFTPTSSSVASTSTSPAAPKSSAPSSSLALKGVLGGAPSPSSSTTSEKPKTTSAPPPPPAPTTSSAPPPPPPPPPPPTTTPKPKPAPTSTAPPPPPTETSGSSGGSTSGGSSGDDGATSASDIAAYLSAHNSVRSAHGASDLTWSDSLAATAQGWANNCVFKHSGGTLGPFGENLAAGTGSSYGIPEAIKSWTDEVSQYDSSNPVPSHFTQVVWKASTQVGCAVQSCDGIFAASLGKAKYYVCEYSPQGNIIGQFGENVQA